MHLGLLTQERLSFDPIKPLILRGPPTEDASSVFTGNVVVSLPKVTKVANITVTFKSTATTYWPEGIGARGTRLTHEKVLSEESVVILESRKNETIKLAAGIHRFPFAFIVPNSIVETIEDVYGRVRHTIDAKCNGPSSGIQLLNNWHVSKPVLVLRAYMSDSLLTNNSLQDLSRTYEKHLSAADVQLVVERAAFSSGDLFYLKLILEPQRKKVRLDHMELTVVENRRYMVAEVNANRQDSEQFILPYLSSVKLVDGSEEVVDGDLKSVFSTKSGGKGVDLTDTIAYRITFATPTCMRNIHHTTYYKDILFRHHLHINLTLSYVDPNAQQRPNLSTHSSTNSFHQDEIATPVSMATEAMIALPPPPQAYHYHHHSATSSRSSSPTPASTPSIVITPSSSSIMINQQEATWLSKLRKPVNSKEGGKHVIRKRETIRLETPITVFDCRLKEDYGRLPSYSELNITSNMVRDDKSHLLLGTSEGTEQDLMLQCMPDRDEQIPSLEPQPQLCPCYFKFRKQMEMANQSFKDDTMTPLLERIPSRPPPDYVA